jgi:hypothetical protein
MNALRIPARAAVAAAVLAVATASSAWCAFDEIEESPRGRALGSACTALRDDGYAVFHNPAGLAFLARGRASLGYLRPFGYDFSSLGAAAGEVALPGALGGVAVGMRRFGVDYMGVQLTHEATIALGHGLRLMRDAQSELAVGWSLQVYELGYGESVTGIDPGHAGAVGLHLGAVAVVRERTRIGVHVANVNHPRIGLDGEDLPQQVSVGISYAPYPGVETVLDLDQGLGHGPQYRAGTEFEITEFLALRAGLSTEPNVFSAGLGIRRGILQLDYAFSTGGGVLGETHHVGVGFSIPEAE